MKKTTLISFLLLMLSCSNEKKLFQNIPYNEKINIFIQDNDRDLPIGISQKTIKNSDSLKTMPLTNCVLNYSTINHINKVKKTKHDEIEEFTGYLMLYNNPYPIYQNFIKIDNDTYELDSNIEEELVKLCKKQIIE